MIRLICGAVALAAGVGCAPIQPLEPASDHPASPQAAGGKDAPLSDVLAVDENSLPKMPAESRRLHQQSRMMRDDSMEEGSHD